MRNVIVIDVRTQCACDAVVTCGTKTNEIIIELNVGNVSSPYFEIYKEDILVDTIELIPSTTNTVILLEDYWALGGTSRIRYKDSTRLGKMFEIIFPETVSDISLTKSSSTTFVVKSYVETSDSLTVNDIINNLTSVDINKALSAYQGNVLDGKISDVEGTLTDQTSALNGKIENANTNIDTLIKSLNTLIQGEDVSNKDFNSLPWRSFVGYGANMTNDPVKNSQCAYLVQQIYSNQQILQIVIALNWQNGDLIYYRRFRNGWGNWYRFANTEQITTINNSISLLNYRFNILKENPNFTLAITGANIIRLVGQITTTAATTIWQWVMSFTDIADKYKPVASRMIKDVSQSYKFELNKAGYIQTAESLPAGTYYFDVAWLARG